MLIQKRCPITKKVNTKDINVTPEQIQLWQEGTLIQIAMPDLSASDREFIMTGICDEEWDKLFGEENSEEELIEDSGTASF